MKDEKKIAIGWQDIGWKLMCDLDNSWEKGFMLKSPNPGWLEKELKKEQIPFVNVLPHDGKSFYGDYLFREIHSMLRGHDRVLTYGALCSHTFKTVLPILLKALNENKIERIDLFTSLAFEFEGERKREIERINLEAIRQSSLPVQIVLYDNNKLLECGETLSESLEDISQHFRMFLKKVLIDDRYILDI